VLNTSESSVWYQQYDAQTILVLSSSEQWNEKHNIICSWFLLVTVESKLNLL